MAETQLASALQAAVLDASAPTWRPMPRDLMALSGDGGLSGSACIDHMRPFLKRGTFYMLLLTAFGSQPTRSHVFLSCAGLVDFAIERSGSEEPAVVIATADALLNQFVQAGHPLRVYFQAAFGGLESGSQRANARASEPRLVRPSGRLRIPRIT